jgi:hypothetical protein
MREGAQAGKAERAFLSVANNEVEILSQVESSSAQKKSSNSSFETGVSYVQYGKIFHCEISSGLKRASLNFQFFQGSRLA